MAFGLRDGMMWSSGIGELVFHKGLGTLPLKVREYGL